ncbi:transaldolase/EF-hand domain-containing protein [Caulifigura coniformis]|uniref:Transaldolase/EF-hand domain-containing protein n=1 Tax=Caulifigura coniformis TaxID=2527983 RepID=A0A517SGX4_9PLAN|nr:hypothetical protein [Caulifigura coniformis]QDT55378.1 transaldolase/EF-hand domain-containing protein [Caulifigura coniformis]
MNRTLDAWASGLLFAFALLNGPVLAQEAAPGPSDAQRVVLLAPAGPVLVGIRLETGSHSIRQVRDAFCDGLFKRLDADQSGKLEAAEQAYLPMFRRVGGGGAAAAQSFATEGVLTTEGLRKYIDDQLGPLFSVEMKAPRADQTVRLLDALDVNDDGVLSLEEVAESAKALARYDLDDDESLSVAELQPFPQSVRQAQRQQAAEEGRGSRVFLVAPPSDLAPVLAEMKKLYAVAEGIEAARCGLKEGAGGFDTNNDGRLDDNELRKWITDGAIDIELTAAWREVGRGLPPVLTTTIPKSPRLVPGRTVSRRQWEARVDDVPMQLNLFDNRGFAGNSVSLFLTKARTLDRDKNDYLDEAEFAGLGTNSPFTAVDLNHDGMVKTDEIREYFQTMSQLSQTRVVMTFSDDVVSLFQVMDADRTNRLSPREMMTLRERVQPFDRNGNGQFDPGDFVSKYTLTMAFAMPEGMEFTPAAMPMTGTTGGVRRTRLGGPLWYQRMDRNRDGDISWREFLGPRARFDAVDTDHDGLISKDEAEAAHALSPEASAQPAADTETPAP